MSRVVEVKSAEDFKAVMRLAPVVVVDFYKSDCGPCKLMEPTFRSLAEDYAGRALFVKVNVDEVPEVASSYRVSVFPTIVSHFGGAPHMQIVGRKPAQAIVNIIEDVLKWATK